MPTWDGILNDDQIWQIVAFIKNSGKLPPEVQEAWRQVGAPAIAPSSPAPPAGPATPGPKQQQ